MSLYPGWFSNPKPITSGKPASLTSDSHAGRQRDCRRFSGRKSRFHSFPRLAALSLAQGAPVWTTRALRPCANCSITLNDTPDAQVKHNGSSVKSDITQSSPCSKLLRLPGWTRRAGVRVFNQESNCVLLMKLQRGPHPALAEQAKLMGFSLQTGGA